MDKHRLFTFIGSNLIFFWFSSFVFVSFFSELFGRFIDGLIFIYMIAAFFAFRIWELKLRKIGYFIFLSFLTLIVFSMLRDYFFGWYNSYTIELYFKTFYYSFSSFLFSYIFYIVLDKRYNLINLFLKILVYYSCFFTITLFFYFIMMGWSIGTSLIYMDFGEDYQGLSRVFGLFFIVLFFLRNYVNLLFFIVSILLCLILIFSFNSFGVFFSIIVMLVFLLTKVFNLKNIIGIFILLLLLFLIIKNTELMNLDLMIDLIDRGSGKLDEGASQDGRSWLFEKSFDLWVSNSLNFIFGPGPIQYACYVGYCESYRHPHNSIMLLLTWFGFFALPYIFILLLSFVVIMKNYFHSNHNGIILISSLAFYYLLLSFIGGDIEQSRFLLFLIPSIYFFSKQNDFKL